MRKTHDRSGSTLQVSSCSNLSEHEKEFIQLIDSQVRQLLERNAPDNAIVSTLIDFAPNARCIVKATGKKQLDRCCKEYPHFAYFLQLINPN
ncbi:hypothetical protein [Legionella jordanis]|uniref:hypothetical protein n=1 Tax=Legionella jordanis TaxID=456 RepID=UPI0007319BBC|nr:hypothetical protein [Legionella jordanis]RMX02511.1 hypothetical protein EAW55_09715 [Legionella jordanis]RMX21642.1 hypothetical protein EAS68_02480 [Legionella jordanis]HAT8713755.1 hypothetical protein [Legionella jordanis]